jgi:hypothetical protein
MLMFTLATALLAANVPGQKAASLELDAIQGTWEVRHVQRTGETDTAPVGASVTFAGDRVTFEAEDVQFGRAAIVEVTQIADGIT